MSHEGDSKVFMPNVWMIQYLEVFLVHWHKVGPWTTILKRCYNGSTIPAFLVLDSPPFLGITSFHKQLQDGAHVTAFIVLNTVVSVISYQHECRDKTL